MNYDWRKLSCNRKGHLWVDNHFGHFGIKNMFMFRSLCGMQYAHNDQELMAVPDDEQLLCKSCLRKAHESDVEQRGAGY